MCSITACSKSSFVTAKSLFCTIAQSHILGLHERTRSSLTFSTPYRGLAARVQPAIAVYEIGETLGNVQRGARDEEDLLSAGDPQLERGLGVLLAVAHQRLYCLDLVERSDLGALDLAAGIGDVQLGAHEQLDRYRPTVSQVHLEPLLVVFEVHLRDGGCRLLNVVEKFSGEYTIEHGSLLSVQNNKFLLRNSSERSPRWRNVVNIQMLCEFKGEFRKTVQILALVVWSWCNVNVIRTTLGSKWLVLLLQSTLSKIKTVCLKRLLHMGNL